MKNAVKNLAAKIFLLAFLIPGSVQAAGIPVFDGANVTQGTITAIESIEQTIQQAQEYALQLQEYATQIQQYEDQVRNTLAPAMYIWSRAQDALNSMQELQGQVEYYTNAVGGIDAYLQKFLDPSEYRYAYSSFAEATGALKDQLREKIDDGENASIEAQRLASEDIMRSLAMQKKQLQADANRLESLQSSAQSALGRMGAIQYGNQLASQMNNHLLQLRNALVAQQTVLAAQAQGNQDALAKDKAQADLILKKRKIEKIEEPNWFQ